VEANAVSLGASYLLPSAARDAHEAGVQLRYRRLFIADLGISAAVAGAFPVSGQPRLYPLLTGEIGVFYLVDLGPVAPYINLGGDYYNGVLNSGRGSHFGVFAAAGLEIALPKGVALDLEYGYRALIDPAGFRTAYQGIGLNLVYRWGAASKKVSRI
jgi:opacity protein-like surface antigen